MANATLDTLLADVTDEKTVVASVVTLLNNLTALLAGAGTDPAKLQAIQDLVDANKAQLAAAVVANTPTPPTPPGP